MNCFSHLFLALRIECMRPPEGFIVVYEIEIQGVTEESKYGMIVSKVEHPKKNTPFHHLVRYSTYRSSSTRPQKAQYEMHPREELRQKNPMPESAARYHQRKLAKSRYGIDEKPGKREFARELQTVINRACKEYVLSRS